MGIYVIFIVIALVSYLVQSSLKSKFERYSKMPIGMTGKEVAEKMLHDNGIYDVMRYQYVLLIPLVFALIEMLPKAIWLSLVQWILFNKV